MPLGHDHGRREQAPAAPPGRAPPAAPGRGCNFTGAWTDNSISAPVCDAQAWGCQKTGAQFWLTDTESGFRGVSHGPADFVHAGNGPYQMGWSHSNATYSDRAGCATRAQPPSCSHISAQECTQPVPPGGGGRPDMAWKMVPNTRVEKFQSLQSWTEITSVTACELKCAATAGCELWTYVWEDPSGSWGLKGGCWAFPRAAQTAFAAEANWTSGLAISGINATGCEQLGCCWHAEGVGNVSDGSAVHCVEKAAAPCEVCVTLDADAPGRPRSTSCSVPAPGSYTNASDYSERTCQSCGAVAADCSSIDWHSGPLSRNATTKQWKREEDIHTVHLVFSTHFDVGCNWNVHTVMDMYFHRYIPQILAIQEGLRGMGMPERLPFLMQPWITSLYVDCPPNLVFDATPNETLRCPSKEEVERYEAAIRRGDIVFQALPFNLQPEAMSPGLFEGAGPPQHGLPSKTMALITSDCGATCSLSTKCP